MRSLPDHDKRVKALAAKTAVLLSAAAKKAIPGIVDWAMLRKLTKANGTATDEGAQVPVDFDWDPFRDLYASSLEDHGAAVNAQAATDLGVDDAELDAMLEASGAVTKQYAADRSAQMIGKTFDAEGDLVDDPSAEMAISESTRNMIAVDVKDALAQGMDADQLAETLKQNYAFSDTRAMRIAETELNDATTVGTLSVWDEAGVEGKQWMLSDAHIDEDECDDNADAGPIPLGDVFPTGDFGPTAHPGCHCYLRAVFTMEAN